MLVTSFLYVTHRNGRTLPDTLLCYISLLSGWPFIWSIQRNQYKWQGSSSWAINYIVLIWASWFQLVLMGKILNVLIILTPSISRLDECVLCSDKTIKHDYTWAKVDESLPHWHLGFDPGRSFHGEGRGGHRSIQIARAFLSILTWSLHQYNPDCIIP